MGVFQERVAQKANNATLCTASISSDMIRWRDVEVDDISTTGLNFYTEKTYKVGQVLKFDLRVYSMMTEFSIPLDGRIIEEKKSVDGFSYAIKYEKIEKFAQIQLDEIFKANMAAKTTSEVATGDGIYSFVLHPVSRVMHI